MSKKETREKRRRGRPCHEISEAAAKSEAARIGARIRRLRLRLGLTIADAAKQAGVPATRWTDWELGRTMVGTLDLVCVLNTLRCELGDVIPEAR